MDFHIFREGLLIGAHEVETYFWWTIFCPVDDLVKYNISSRYFVSMGPFRILAHMIVFENHPFWGSWLNHFEPITLLPNISERLNVTWAIPKWRSGRFHQKHPWGFPRWGFLEVCLLGGAGHKVRLGLVVSCLKIHDDFVWVEKEMKSSLFDPVSGRTCSVQAVLNHDALRAAL